MPLILVLDEQNMYIRNDGRVGTLTTDGSTPKHNNRIVEITEESIEKQTLELGSFFNIPYEIVKDATSDMKRIFGVRSEDNSTECNSTKESS